MAAAVGDHTVYQSNFPTRYPPQSLPPYSKHVQENKNFSGLPPYYNGNGYFAGVDIANLPPLPETPSESDDLIHDFANRLPQDSAVVRYPYVNQISPSLPWNGQEVFQYYSPDHADQAVLYFSADEDHYEHRYSPGDTCYLRFSQGYPQSAINSSVSLAPHGIMGSASSALAESQPPVSSQKQKKNRGVSGSIDSVGYESSASKPGLGVKEKLRSSLDKISLKPPFRWSSSDKLTNNTGSTSSKSSKSKNNRRYSDSSAAFALNNTPPVPDSGKAAPRTSSTSCDMNSSVKESKPRDKSWRQGVSRLVRPYGNEKNDLNSAETYQPRKTNAPPDYVNLGNTAVKLVRQSNRQSDVGVGGGRGRQERYMNDYQVTAPSHHLYDLTPKTYRSDNGKDTAARAKGTWNMLKSAKTKQAPMKAAAPHSASYASLLSGSSETLQSSDTLQGRNYDSLTTPEQHPPIERTPSEPPKLAPVSGMLLVDKDAETTILRPTAFKPIAQAQYKTSSSNLASPHPAAHGGSWERVASFESSPRDGYSALGPERKTSVSSDSNHSDSGRISATSIPVGNNIGNSFSCSGSEGYESARVSSSTNHSAMHEADLNASDLLAPISPKNLTDDVMIRDLECRVKAKEGELQLLRRSFEDNEKALHMVYEDRHMSRETEVLELKQRYSSQLRSQARQARNAQEKIERRCQISQEENKQLLRTNIELEDRIKSVTDAFEEQARQNENIAELKARLEESESQMQQKHGEISHLKYQLKERQVEVTQRTGDVIALRNQNRDLRARLRERDADAADLNSRLNDKDREAADLEKRLCETESSLANLLVSDEQRVDLGTSPQGSQANDVHEDQAYLPSMDRGRGGSSAGASSSDLGRDELLHRLEQVERRCTEQAQEFEKQRRQWAEEKNRVIRYQKQLQLNYVQIYKRSQALEEEVERLTAQVQGKAPSPDGHSSDGSSPPVSSVNLCYPMEI